MRSSSPAATLLAALLLCGCGNQGAVSSSTSLDELGTRLAEPGMRTAGLVDGSGYDSEQVTKDDATEDRACPGGHRRVFKATVTSRRALNDDESGVRNRMNLAAQAGLKDAGAKVTTELGGGASTVPATLDFTNEPSDAAEKRSYRTTVKLGPDTYTWSITGRTACIAD